MYFDFYVARDWEYLPALSVATVYKLYTDPGYFSAHHRIDGDKYILFFTMEGAGVVEVGGIPYAMKANTVLCANTQVSLQYRCAGEKWNFWLVEFKTEEPMLQPNQVLSLAFRPEYQELFTRTLEELRGQHPLLAAANFQTLCCTMALHLENAADPGDTRLFTQCVEYIEDHMSSFSVKQFCEDVGISPRTLHNLFRRVVGASPYQYYQRLRAERSKELLENTDMTVAQVAASLGYLNSGHFSHIFKGYFGKTPRRYRTDFHLTP